MHAGRYYKLILSPDKHAWYQTVRHKTGHLKILATLTSVWYRVKRPACARVNYISVMQRRRLT